MSFSSYKDVIEEGDTVILYLNPNNMHAIEVKPTIINKTGKSVDNVFQTIYGALHVKDLIGKMFGKRITLTRGWAYVLHPTPELWTLTLPHRTQIIYTPDISMIILQLEIKPGSVVIESGTGSGSLSHALARCVRPNGHVYSYDFHEQRVLIARKEFDNHGLSDIITVEQRDVCQSGFSTDCDGKADAVFLDLPHPWLVVPFAESSMKKSGGRLCSFSPCVEQVQKTCLALHENGFEEISTMECLQRELCVQTKSFPVVAEDKNESENTKTMITTVAKNTMPGHTGYLTFATLPPVWARNPISAKTDSTTTNQDTVSDCEKLTTVKTEENVSS
ncbi:tRNA methyltransferase 61 [Lycorma delicatula]|uniref:tRNA methyltransferase 61 n=1 Tax=Lycorma delicatula TaxID=130591 RepID=UPI003F514B48